MYDPRHDGRPTHAHGQRPGLRSCRQDFPAVFSSSEDFPEHWILMEKDASGPEESLPDADSTAALAGDLCAVAGGEAAGSGNGGRSDNDPFGVPNGMAQRAFAHPERSDSACAGEGMGAYNYSCSLDTAAPYEGPRAPIEEEMERAAIQKHL
ncbi:uncharacterized protein LOC129587279 isoform X2 [Paramacrobiotus metropolitanus]|uniref:uncharacterized protein LOC129587279 isoform X2 n=1 Tax=Paramacrobiotus metropolitanus TaxID=2943436 RepID=UPI00244653A1|nr:uncharacterized protein LOC129587279 isoform X2 [Paramacrobiotus metropolitanus]